MIYYSDENGTLKRAPSDIEFEDVNRKKVKLECPNSAELIKRMSSEHQVFDNAILSKTLDDMF